MNIVFLIGNGFDLNLNLKTKYCHFYKYYISTPSKHTTIEEFKKVLSENLENWADLELELGKYSKEFGTESENDFVELLYDIQDALAEYLDKQDSEFNVSEGDIKKSTEDLFKFEKYLSQREREEFIKYKSQIEKSTLNIRVITFNYTRTLEKIYKWAGKPLNLGNRNIGNSAYSSTFQAIEHIHGTTESIMIMGVNDSSQIENESLRNSTRLRRALVKTEMNINAGTMRDDRCQKWINDADIVCVFGMAMGETDRYWWNIVGERIAKSAARLFIFDVAKEIPSRREYMIIEAKDELKNKFVSRVDLDEKSKEKIKNQTYVCVNSDMFKVKLNYPEKKTDLEKAVAFAAENGEMLAKAGELIANF